MKRWLFFVILNILITKEFGVYHASGQGRCSWFEFACEIVSNFKIDAEILPCKTEEFKRKAKRPKFSELENFMLKTIGKIILETEKEAVANFARKHKFFRGRSHGEKNLLSNRWDWFYRH